MDNDTVSTDDPSSGQRPDQPAAPPPAQPAAPRDAATVVLLRDATQGVEVYLVKRSRMVDFMAGAHVFPGGRLDKSDSSPSACALLSAGPAALQKRLGEPLPAAHAAGLFVAAVRETFEEAGLLLGQLAAGWKMNDARSAVAEGAQFTTLLERIDAAALVPWLRWVTPEISPRRFNARFFLARAPAGQEPRVDGREATEGLWIAPDEALRRWADDQMQLAPATAKSIELLCAHATVDAALAAAAQRLPPVAMPLVWNDQETGHAFISLPGDPRHPEPDFLGGAMRRFQLVEGRYRSVKAV
jgi:8-oxo-dGTP pyrophosphatase MutT (NUDIX family)